MLDTESPFQAEKEPKRYAHDPARNSQIPSLPFVQPDARCKPVHPGHDTTLALRNKVPPVNIHSADHTSRTREEVRLCSIRDAATRLSTAAQNWTAPAAASKKQAPIYIDALTSAAHDNDAETEGRSNTDPGKSGSVPATYNHDGAVRRATLWLDTCLRGGAIFHF